jgi:hypothetical protein
MPNIPSQSVIAPQTFCPLYLTINGTLQSYIQDITVDQMSGASDVETIVMGWAGVALGAAKIECTLKGVVPCTPTNGADTGTGFGAGGITAAGVPLDQTMITQLNQNQNQPVSFVIGIGGFASGAETQLAFAGFIKDVNINYAVGKQLDVTYKATGKFQLFQ